MRRPSWLAITLALLYLIPAFILDALLVSGLQRSYSVFDIAGMTFVSAPAGFLFVPLLENRLPLSQTVAWGAVLVSCQFLNVTVVWLVVRGIKAAVAYALWGRKPPSPEEAEKMR